MNCVPAEFVGVPTATLQLWLSEVQLAIQSLAAGKTVQSAAYTQGDGNKAVAFTKADLQYLRNRAHQLALALGLVNRRRPMRTFF